uniref:Uncharacterized protein n=1 Tax=Rhizophora mucronata TaxID=61149 RepID=A0A2P2NWY5_RHIMU
MHCLCHWKTFFWCSFLVGNSKACVFWNNKKFAGLADYPKTICRLRLLLLSCFCCSSFMLRDF